MHSTEYNSWETMRLILCSQKKTDWNCSVSHVSGWRQKFEVEINVQQHDVTQREPYKSKIHLLGTKITIPMCATGSMTGRASLKRVSL